MTLYGSRYAAQQPFYFTVKDERPPYPKRKRKKKTERPRKKEKVKKRERER